MPLNATNKLALCRKGFTQVILAVNSLYQLVVLRSTGNCLSSRWGDIKTIFCMLIFCSHFALNTKNSKLQHLIKLGLPAISNVQLLSCIIYRKQINLWNLDSTEYTALHPVIYSGFDKGMVQYNATFQPSTHHSISECLKHLSLRQESHLKA